MKQILFIIILTGLTFSCEEEPVEIPDFEIGNSERVVLLEDLTGVQCPNCPKGSATIETMLELFGDNLAVIGIHGRLQAEPLPESKYDFRTQMAEDLEELHRPFLGKPSALINRKTFENEFFKAVDLVDLWPGYVEQELREPPKVQILHITKFDSTNRTISLEVSLLANEALSNDSKISIFITESHIEDVQETIGSIIEDFEHNHIIRDMLTKFDGDPVGMLQTNVPFRKTFTYSLPDQYNANNTEIIIAVADGSPEGGEILQAAKIRVTE